MWGRRALARRVTARDEKAQHYVATRASIQTQTLIATGWLLEPRRWIARK